MEYTVANVKEENRWEEGVYQIEVTDPVVGGVDGISNKQAKQLANRTSYLKEKVDALTPAKIFEEIKKIDGTDSGLDADKLDGLDSTAFVQKDTEAALCTLHLTSNNRGDNLKIGDDAYLGDIGSNSTLGIRGIGNEGKGFIKFGKDGPTLGNDGDNTLTCNGARVVLGDATSAAQANSIVARDGNADFEARYVAATSFKSNANVDDALMNAQSEIMFREPSDKFLRPASLAKFKEVINGVDFACQKNPNGYTKLPNGLILQWGSIAIGLPGERAFPIAFPNIVLAVIAGNADAQGAGVDNAFAYAISKEKFYYGTKTNQGLVSAFPGSYIAIGY